MKKTILLVLAFISAVHVFAQYGDYGYADHSDDMSAFNIFFLIVCIAYIIVSIVILIRWWIMTKDIKQLREYIVQDRPKLTYLLALGEKDKAQKAALKMLVDVLYPIYISYGSTNTKVENMNKEIQKRLPRILRLGLSVPDYVTTGEKFIAFMNDMTGNKQGLKYPQEIEKG